MTELRHGGGIKLVYVRPYRWFRYGEWEHVRSHFRRAPA